MICTVESKYAKLIVLIVRCSLGGTRWKVVQY